MDRETHDELAAIRRDIRTLAEAVSATNQGAQAVQRALVTLVAGSPAEAQHATRKSREADRQLRQAAHEELARVQRRDAARAELARLKATP